MNVNRSLITWGVIIGLIAFSGLASVFWPSISGSLLGAETGGNGAQTSGGFNITPSDDVIELKNPISGDVIEINEWMALIGMTVLVGAITIGAGLPLVLLFRALDNGVTTVKADEGFQASVAARTQREKDVVKEYIKTQPPDPIPSHDRPQWSVISTSLCMGLLFAFLGAAYSGNFLDERNMGAYAFWFAVTGIVLGLLTLNARRVQQTDADEGSPLPGSALWILVTGVVVVGLGVGVMMWVRAGGV